MTSLARQSPSGPLVDLETTTDLLDNVSTVPGSSATDALLFLDQRAIQYLDTEDGPVGLWNFNQTLNGRRRGERGRRQFRCGRRGRRRAHRRHHGNRVNP